MPLFAAEEAGLGEFLIDAVSGVMADATAVPARHLWQASTRTRTSKNQREDGCMHAWAGMYRCTRKKACMHMHACVYMCMHACLHLCMYDGKFAQNIFIYLLFISIYFHREEKFETLP